MSQPVFGCESTCSCGCGLLRVLGGQGDDPTPVFHLIALVKLGIVSAPGLPHFPEDFEPALPQAAKRAGVGLAFVAFFLIVRLRPGTLRPAEVGPQVDRMAECFLAGPPKAHPLDFPAFKAHRSRAGVALQCLR